jgi:hypothetical protein
MPLARLAAGIHGRHDFAQLAASRGIETVTAFLVVNVDAIASQTEIAAGDGGAGKVIGAVRPEHIGKREFPETTTVVSIDRSQGVDPFDEHASSIVQRRGTAAVPLRHFQIDVAKPKRVQFAANQFVFRATAIRQIGILVRPTAALSQFAATEELHVAHATRAGHTAERA